MYFFVGRYLAGIVTCNYRRTTVRLHGTWSVCSRCCFD